GQDCVCVHIALFWIEPPDLISSYQSWLIEVPDHAAARVLERAPASDLRSCLFEAADAYASADAQAVRRCLISDRSICLRAVSRRVRLRRHCRADQGEEGATWSPLAPAPFCPTRCANRISCRWPPPHPRRARWR